MDYLASHQGEVVHITEMKERRMHPRRESLTDAERDRVADVFRTHQRFLENVARQHAPSADYVPDIVQSVGMKLCQSLNGFRDESAITTWLYRVTVNTARDCYQGERRFGLATQAAAIPDPEVVLDPDDLIVQGERLAALDRAIDRLKPLHQDLIREQLAGTAVLSARRSTRHKARRQLRRLLSDDPWLDTE